MSHLLRTIRIGQTDVDIGSDFHWPTQGQHGIKPQNACGNLLHELLIDQRSDFAIIAGDVFHAADAATEGPIDVSSFVSRFLQEFSRHYKMVCFLPGNHCLRRSCPTDDPWDSFDLPNNVTMPYGVNPETVMMGSQRFALANLMYDGSLLEGDAFSMQAYRDVFGNDSTSLLRGVDSRPVFQTMTQNAATALTPEIDMLVTHCAPHRNGIKWLASLPSDDWQLKLGSNVFAGELGARPKNNLFALFGHTHQSEDHVVDIEGVNIRFVSHQPLQRCR